MRVGIRVDVSAQMGTGHLKRSAALAHALEGVGAETLIVSRPLGLDPAAILPTALRERVIPLERPTADFEGDPTIAHSAWARVSSAQDASDTAQALAKFQPDWVVLDSYSFGANWHEKVREALGCRMAQIDDLADRSLACDLLIDHNFADDHREKYSGLLAPETAIVGGPQYALLGPEYTQAQRYEFKDSVHSIGVFMGGADPDNFSGRALDALNAAGFDGEIEVVTTRANPNLEALKSRIAELDNARLTLDLPHLADFFARHDLQIGAGGGATWERCCLGAPTLAAICADNQRAVLLPLTRSHALDLHNHRPIDVSTMAQEIKGLVHNSAKRAQLASNAIKLVDGQGTKRVAEVMEEMLAA